MTSALPFSGREATDADKPIRVSVVIATYNRSDDLLQTVPQVLSVMGNSDELVVVDQTPHEPDEVRRALAEFGRDPRMRLVRLREPSLTVARNVGLLESRGTVVVYLDDDVNVEPGLIESHLAAYADPDVAGVAGAYYMGTRALVWQPSRAKDGAARSITGVHMSFRRTALLAAGGIDTNFSGAAAGEDWELGERVRREAGPIAAGDHPFVLHRIAAVGGCGNRARGLRWYEDAYHNHVYWMLKRPWPDLVIRLPRHCYWIYRYHLPPRATLLTAAFLFGVVPRGVARGISTWMTGRRPPYWAALTEST